MDVFQPLREDHLTFRRLFARIEQTAPGDVGTRWHLMQDLEMLLRIHDAVERQIFYPACRTRESMRMLVHDSEKVHDEIDLRLEDIAACPPDHARWLPLVVSLERMLDLHMRVEESTVFVLIEDSLPGEKLGQLAGRIWVIHSNLASIREEEIRRSVLRRAA